MEVLSINNEEELIKLIQFIKKNFGWSKKKSLKIKEAILENNKLFGKYGYFIKDKDKNIKGGFLIFFQGYFKNNKEKIMVLNMSSLFVDKSIRGIASLKLIRIFLNDYSSSLITNLSTNFLAYKILKSFGFKNTYTYNKKYFLNSIIFNSNLYNLKKILEVFNYKNSKVLQLSKLNKLSNKQSISLNIGNKKIKIIFSLVKYEKNLGSFYFKIPFLRILWVSNYKLYKLYSSQILLFFLINYSSIFITTHFERDARKDKNKSSENQIYYFSDKNIQKNINFIVGSELTYL